MLLLAQHQPQHKFHMLNLRMLSASELRSKNLTQLNFIYLNLTGCMAFATALDAEDESSPSRGASESGTQWHGKGLAKCGICLSQLPHRNIDFTS